MLAALLASAFAQDICPSGCTFTSWQAAVDTVAPGDSATFTVEPGVYDEVVSITDGRDIRFTTSQLVSFEPVVLSHGPLDGRPLLTVRDARLELYGITLEADLRRAIDAVDSDLDLDLVNVFGRGLGARGAQVSVTRGSLAASLSTFSGGAAGLEGGQLYAVGADITLSAVSMVDGAAPAGGCLTVKGGAEGGTLSVDGIVLRGCSSGLAGGAMLLSGDLSAELFALVIDESSAGEGGAIAFDEGVVATIDIANLTDNSALALGGALRIRGATVTAHDVNLYGNSADKGGAVAVLEGGSLDLSYAVLGGNAALADGGATFVGEASLAQLDVLYDGNQATLGNGGGLHLASGATWVSEQRATYCGNAAQQGGAVFSDLSADATVTNVRYIDNAAVQEGGGVSHRGDGQLTLSFANLLGNSAGLGSGAGLLTTSVVHLDHALVLGNVGAVAVLARGARGEVVPSYTAWYDNEAGDLAGLSPDTDDAVFADPQLDRYVPGEPCLFAQDWPSYVSPLRDAGDPARTDPDGSTADIGAYGGLGADPRVWEDDLDNDGFSRIYDCNDGDASVYPEADDAPYDGLDADCDGSDDFDADGDGFRTRAYGGTDCDDTDPFTFPGAPEDPFGTVDNNCDGVLDADLDGFTRDIDCDDGDPLTYPGAPDDDNRVDRNCDGSIDGPRVFQTAACQSAPAPLWVWWLVVLYGARRRQSS
jgi:hypothetical protein